MGRLIGLVGLFWGDEEIQSRIFDPFFTTKQMGKGTGLGLASVYGVIKGHGGHVAVNSEKVRGSTFSMYLPASYEKAFEPVSKPARIISGKEVVLLVDDEEAVLDANTRLLEALGHTVLAAASGREAVEIFKRRDTIIDLVILDMIMPELSGSETYDELKKINPRVKVILSSGYSMDGQASKILERGCDGFLQKPFDMRDLSSKIEKALRSGERAPCPK